MNITVGEKSIDVRFTTRSMIQFEERFKIKDSMQFWKKAAAGPNVKILADALWQFSEELKSESDAYDFIDDYRADNSLYSLYEELIKEVNEGGFFRKKYQPDELKKEMEAPELDMDKIINSAMAELAQSAIETGAI